MGDTGTLAYLLQEDEVDDNDFILLETGYYLLLEAGVPIYGYIFGEKDTHGKVIAGERI